MFYCKKKSISHIIKVNIKAFETILVVYRNRYFKLLNESTKAQKKMSSGRLTRTF